MNKLIAIVLGLASCASAFAQGAPAAPPPQAVTPAIPAPVTQPLPSTRWTAEQARQAFELADANSDRQLTRAEAQRLPIMPRSFEDTDLNKDGVITLDEYVGSFAAQ